jgi:hypothetical protein
MFGRTADIQIRRRTVDFVKNAGHFSDRCNKERITNCADVVNYTGYLITKYVGKYAACTGRIQPIPVAMRVKAAGL